VASKILASPLQKTAGLGFFCLLIAAFFSKGFYHFDEHFQILEFAQLKLARSLPTELPWEFHAKMRSALQPTIVLWVHKILRIINLEDPFIATLVLRILTAVLTWATTVKLLKAFAKEVPEKWLTDFVIPFSFLFWLSVFNGVRFSSENWGGLFFALGLCWAHQVRRTFWAEVFSGFLLGISFLSRFQMGLMILGLVAWLVFIKKDRLRQLLPIGLGFGIVLILGLALDHTFYGDWPVTFWNYFKQNIIEGKAAQFGVQPWYEYFRILFIDLIPPFSIFFIFGLLAFFWLYPRHIITFSLLPFLLIHMGLGHKEARFLFPILYFFPVILGLGFSALSLKLYLNVYLKSFLKRLVLVFWGVNGVLLLVVMFHPADKDTELYEAIYRANPDKLLITKENPFSRAGFDLKYYQRPGLNILTTAPGEETERDSVKTLVVTLDSDAMSHSDKVIYRSAPDWIQRFNFNHWLDRTKLWVVFWQ
jgi:phosphatidylinositol glycan class B